MSIGAFTRIIILICWTLATLKVSGAVEEDTTYILKQIAEKAGEKKATRLVVGCGSDPSNSGYIIDENNEEIHDTDVTIDLNQEVNPDIEFDFTKALPQSDGLFDTVYFESLPEDILEKNTIYWNAAQLLKDDGTLKFEWNQTPYYEETDDKTEIDQLNTHPSTPFGFHISILQAVRELQDDFDLRPLDYVYEELPDQERRMRLFILEDLKTSSAKNVKHQPIGKELLSLYHTSINKGLLETFYTQFYGKSRSKKYDLWYLVTQYGKRKLEVYQEMNMNVMKNFVENTGFFHEVEIKRSLADSHRIHSDEDIHYVVTAKRKLRFCCPQG